MLPKATLSISWCQHQLLLPWDPLWVAHRGLPMAALWIRQSHHQLLLTHCDHFGGTRGMQLPITISVGTRDARQGRFQVWCSTNRWSMANYHLWEGFWEKRFPSHPALTSIEQGWTTHSSPFPALPFTWLTKEWTPCQNLTDTCMEPTIHHKKVSCLLFGNPVLPHIPLSRHSSPFPTLSGEVSRVFEVKRGPSSFPPCLNTRDAFRIPHWNMGNPQFARCRTRCWVLGLF